MEFSDEIKKQIVEGFIGIFTRIASKEFQKRAWITGEGSEVDSYEDTVCDYFGECDSILTNYKEFGITEVQYNLLKKFKTPFERFSDENDWPPEFIDTPEWTRITEMAQEILKEFNYKKIRK